MKIISPSRIKSQLAYTMVEVLMGVALIGVMFVTLYGGMSSGFAITQVARENLRATQIMLERMEGIRLYNWNQIIYSNMIPKNFTNYYYPLASNAQSRGIAYLGTMVISPAALSPSASYADAMRTVTVTITWTNGNAVRNRSMSTYVSRNGVQNYVFYN